jgi:hypothetical protein
VTVRGKLTGTVIGPLAALPDGFAVTVASLHRVAEELVAPARKPDNEIALEPTAGGFGTPEFEFEGAPHRVRVEGVELVHSVGGLEHRAPLTSLATGASIVSDLLPPGAAPSGEPLRIDPDAARVLAGWYAFGAAVLAHLVSLAARGEHPTPPILWPEHFDIAVEIGDEAGGWRATYGLSPGDENHPEPYLYVAPWTGTVSGSLWTARGFGGAELGYRDLLSEPDPRTAAVVFFTTRWDLLAMDARRKTRATPEEEK